MESGDPVLRRVTRHGIPELVLVENVFRVYRFSPDPLIPRGYHIFLGYRHSLWCWDVPLTAALCESSGVMTYGTWREGVTVWHPFSSVACRVCKGFFKLVWNAGSMLTLLLTQHGLEPRNARYSSLYTRVPLLPDQPAPLLPRGNI